MSTPDEIVDVVVAGSGGGTAGAYTAAREGLSVAVVEATDRFGGTFAYSGGGGMWYPCNPVVLRAGVDDTIEEALRYYRGVVGDRTPAELQEAYVRGGAALIEYLERDDHFAFKILPWPDYYSSVPGARADGMRHIVSKAVPDSRLGRFAGLVRGPLDHERLGAPQPDLLTGGRALIGRFLSAMADNPAVAAHLNTTLVEPIVDGRDEGRVVGAVVESDGRRRVIRARRGVLLAAGGFERNDAMRAEYGVPGAAFDTMGAPGNLGLAHRAAISVGAATDLMDQAWWSPGLVHPDGRAAFALCFTGGIFVDRDGRRFVNESAAYDRLARDIIRAIGNGRVGSRYWMVYDSRNGDQPPVMATNVSFSPTKEYVSAGLWRQADSVAELAGLIGVPADNLVATVRRFNEFARRGDDDDFGRGREAFDRTFTAGASPLVPIDTPPYRAAAFGLSDLGTKGGLRTDIDARVLDADGRPIPGLYAAGNTMAAVSGETYPGGGNPIGASLLFSHRAALHMAAAR
ncbi:3-ketosteroid-delta-1-dehydrogenase [Mycolicibacterium agri]|uniref:3-ketosteroid-delta-1-dehydrogenase n=1 Tax=Mycolicibacterium agri TaxID=36811 RepID=A0A2A7MRL3_MYCAG|nr:FAD-binding protein [Mycolicibacterium agri]PEG34190.1 3-ketosteroid-delta-1-dehydrogenase [Mycolicibacterium agri]GFG50276.1 3-ketosteroid-delta-1-dehydrogenase [Mycolicibacterium agri]